MLGVNIRGAIINIRARESCPVIATSAIGAHNLAGSLCDRFPDHVKPPGGSFCAALQPELPPNKTSAKPVIDRFSRAQSQRSTGLEHPFDCAALEPSNRSEHQITPPLLEIQSTSPCEAPPLRTGIVHWPIGQLSLPSVDNRPRISPGIAVRSVPSSRT